MNPRSGRWRFGREGGQKRLSGDFRALIARPGYRRFALTVGLARASATMFIASGVLFVLAVTGRPAVAGATVAASVLPAALAGPWLGALLDASHHRRLLIVADQLASVLALCAMLVLGGHAADWTLPLAGLFYGITRSFSLGGFFTALTGIAGPDLLEEAGRIESVSLNLAFMVGPALAGVIAGAAGARAAIVVQIVLTTTATGLIAANPIFDTIEAPRALSARHAVRAGLHALRHERMLRAPGIAALMATFGWGLMNLGFPLYATHILHTGAHASGYMWAAVGAGSTIGTFLLAGPATLRRIAGSYLALGLSALLWPLAHAPAVGVALIGVTGVLEGPAYSGTIALRQRHVPPEVTAQVITTLGAASQVAVSAGAVLAGVMGSAPLAIAGFTAVNLLAALVAWRA